MDKASVRKASDELFAALENCSTVTPLRERYPDITIDSAYQVSLDLLKKRLARGEKLIGKKIGVTSKAVQDMLNVRQPDFGFLTDRMVFSDTVPLSGNMIQPKAEGEIAFIMKDTLKARVLLSRMCSMPQSLLCPVSKLWIRVSLIGKSPLKIPWQITRPAVFL